MVLSHPKRKTVLSKYLLNICWTYQLVISIDPLTKLIHCRGKYPTGRVVCLTMHDAWTQPSWCGGDVRAIRYIGWGRSAGAVPDGFDVRSAWRIYQRKGISMTNLACRLRGSFNSADPPRRSSWLVRIEIFFFFFLFSFLSPMAYVVSILLLLLAKPTKELQKIQPLAEVTQLSPVHTNLMTFLLSPLETSIWRLGKQRWRDIVR